MPVRDVGRAYGHRGMLLLAATVQARQWIQDVYSVVLSIFLGCMHALRTTDDTKRGLGWRSGSKGLGFQGHPSSCPASPVCQQAKASKD